MMHLQQSSYPDNLNLYMSKDFLGDHGNKMKQVSHQMSNQYLSSTQLSDPSIQVSQLSEVSQLGQHTSTQSDSSGNQDINHMKSVLSMGNVEAGFPLPELDHNQPFALLPNNFTEPSFAGVLNTNASHAIVHPQMVGAVAPVLARIPLPVELAAVGPIFVNAKQYHAILRRRQLRAKLEAENKLVKARKHQMHDTEQGVESTLLHQPIHLLLDEASGSKPYLHESRHLHAMKRARGATGRFLNTKQLQLQPIISSNGPTGSSATPTSSDTTTVSTSGGILSQQDHLSFSSADHYSHTVGSFEGGGNQDGPDGNGLQLWVPFMR